MITHHCSVCHEQVTESCETHPNATIESIVSLDVEQQTLLDHVTADHTVSDPRLDTLRRAVSIGADEHTLALIRGAVRVSKSATIVLPANKLEGCSRGRGWARKGKGNSAEWGERVDGGYRVGPGKWSVGATDGFSRKRSDEWVVRNIKVGTETWTIAE